MKHSSVLLITLLISSPLYSEIPGCPTEKSQSRLEFKHREHKGVGYDDGYTTFELFMSPAPRYIMQPFLDARTHVFNNGKFASNLGVGLRVPTMRNRYIWGGNFYYDFRSATNLSTHQVGFGFELLSKIFDLRFNGYFPIAGKRFNQLKFNQFKGHNAIVKRRLVRALTSYNLELGRDFSSIIGDSDLYAAIGPYYLCRQNVGGKALGGALGGKARLAFKILDGISLGMDVTYDRIFNFKLQGYLSWSFPKRPATLRKNSSEFRKTYKGGPCRDWARLTARLTQNVERNEIIPIIDKTNRFALINPLTGEPYFFYFVNNLSSSDGSFESPFPTLVQAQNASSPNDIIYVFPGDGTTTGYSAGITLKNNQILQGASTDLILDGVVIPAQTPANSPTMTNTLGVGVTLAQGTVVQGMIISGAVGSGISGDGVGSILIRNNTIQNTSVSGSNGNAVTLDNLSGSYFIENNILVSNALSGILLLNTSNTSIAISENTISSNGAAGIAIGAASTGSNNSISIVSNTLTSNVSTAIFAINLDQTSYKIKNNTINIPTATALSPIGLNSATDIDVLIQNNTISDQGTGALQTFIMFTGTALSSPLCTIDGNSISVNSPGAILDGTPNGITTIKNNTITNAFVGGIGNGSIISFTASAAADSVINMTNNLVNQTVSGHGIVISRVGRYQTLIENNAITTGDNNFGLFIFNAAVGNTICAQVNNNSAPEYIFQNVDPASLLRLSSNTGDVATSNTATGSPPFTLVNVTEVGSNPGACPP